MPIKPSKQVRQLAGQILDLPTSEAGADQLMGLVREAISALTALEQQSDSRLMLRCQVSRLELQTEVTAFLEAYGRATDQREKVTRLTQARSKAHYLLWWVLQAAAR
jgi:hypothetical protein